MPVKGKDARVIWGEAQQGQAVTGTDTYYSNTMSLRVGSGTGHHMEWSGTPTGTLTFWVSNKPQPREDSDTDWVQITDFTITNPAGSASKAFYNLGNMQANRARWKYVNASGSGTLYGWATSKDT